ncbi:nucleotidyltransferase family protein [Desulfovibrio litoralis]|uniref:Molybdenum cofactor cytidylyltransferase n=1 Tax=Desulfovibrio litoralis DSM 11393 TaxID=1121455 RepID=A0A1M7TJ65_9BACT|nr:nucleotidyltransferase family protein [Desulfovibrio litoralis]SHN70751.1 molybdenum cofactor cytidylyltransferase [Desulfovibrio litoralis DSM 11393]
MSDPLVAILALAAGAGSRLGGAKQLLPFKDKPLLAHSLLAVNKMIGVKIKACVLGCEASAVQNALLKIPSLHSDWVFLDNKNWNKGQSTSLSMGLDWLLKHKEAERIDAVLVLLGDMPLVQPETIDNILNAYTKAWRNGHKMQAVIPMHKNKRGNPVLLAKSLFPELMNISGDKGARKVLHSVHPKLFLPVNDQGVLRDIDTPEDYAGLCSE